MNIKRKAALSGVAVLLASATLAACGSDDSDSDTGDEAGGDLDFLPCIVSDAGGFDDKSFNQASFEGLESAADELGVEIRQAESNSDQDFGPNLETMVGEGCNAIVTVGFALSAATIESATANPDINYVLIDDAADADGDGTKDADNIKPLLYNTAQAAFLAGYVAADYSKSGVVGTYGGQPYPTVTIFMDGFKQGVDYYNAQKGKSVQVKGWDGKDGAFTGGFTADNVATQTAKSLIDQGADVLLPVGGPIYQGALTAIADSGKDVALIGVDVDFFESDPKTQPYVLTSILKNMEISTNEAIVAAGNGEFDAETYIGTLENDGVGIAPFHEFESKVSSTLQSELDEVKAGIIDGSIPVASYLG